MEERRKYDRYFTKIKAQYRLKEEEDWRECTIINLSHRGMNITFQTSEDINVGSTIYMKVFLSENPKLINVKGVIKWIEQSENDHIGGIEVTILTKEM
jgi:Tfp pilus assembly protein PilZ